MHSQRDMRVAWDFARKRAGMQTTGIKKMKLILGVDIIWNRWGRREKRWGTTWILFWESVDYSVRPRSYFRPQQQTKEGGWVRKGGRKGGVRGDRRPDDEENATARIAPCLAVCPPAVVDMSVPTFPGLVLTDNAPRCTFIALLSEKNRKGGRCFGEKKMQPSRMKKRNNHHHHHSLRFDESRRMVFVREIHPKKLCFQNWKAGARCHEIKCQTFRRRSVDAR